MRWGVTEPSSPMSKFLIFISGIKFPEYHWFLTLSEAFIATDLGWTSSSASFLLNAMVTALLKLWEVSFRASTATMVPSRFE